MTETAGTQGKGETRLFLEVSLEYDPAGELKEKTNSLGEMKDAAPDVPEVAGGVAESLVRP